MPRLNAPLPAITVSLVLLALQGSAALFFLLDGIDDAVGPNATEAGWPSVMEIIVALALVAGIMLSAINLRYFIRHAREAHAAVSMAQGAFADLMRDRFDRWNLSASESEVALFSLKGYSIGEIASLRGSAHGTVRSQLSQVYAKAGVDGRAMLAASFIEDLIDGAPETRNASEISSP